MDSFGAMRHLPHLRRIIIEVTNLCNLDCSICLRQSWSGDLGIISEIIFSKLISDIGDFHPPLDVLLGGYGEPLSHPDILEMIRQLKDHGCRTALITNGTLLTPDLTKSLVESGLGKIWVSADNFHQQAIISKSSIPSNARTLSQIAEIQRSGNGKLEELNPGLSMVLAKNNQAEILTDIEQALKLGIRSFFITNLEAYSPLEVEEIPYTLGQLRRPGAWHASSTDLIKKVESISINNPGVSISGVLTHHQEKCPFAEKGDLVLRWDGETSPCLPLLYDRTTHIESWEHKQIAHSFGNIRDRSISEIWEDRDFSRLRERLLNNEFSPCLSCRDCWFSDDNMQDCMGFEHPTCGGCLWAEGLICCP
jgi:MoaA/NifB/PqqE/SkfB family radical SAM enzyme